MIFKVESRFMIGWKKEPIRKWHLCETFKLQTSLSEVVGVRCFIESDFKCRQMEWRAALSKNIEFTISIFNVMTGGVGIQPIQKSARQRRPERIS